MTGAAANRIVLLCSGGGPAAPGRGVPGTAALLDLDGRRIVIDAGPGVVAALQRAGVDLATIDTVCITHLHAGHMMDLGALAHGIWTAGRTGGLTLWGPPGIVPCWQGFVAAMAHDSALRAIEAGRPPLRDMVVLHELHDGPLDDGPLRMDAVHVPHPPVEQCFALRFAGSRTVTFAADASFHAPLAVFARGSDVLVHVAALPGRVDEADTPDPARPRAPHATPEQAGRIARLSRAGRLVLHPLIAALPVAATDWTDAVARHWPGNVTLGCDGLQIDL